jgi:hypothetical protein
MIDPQSIDLASLPWLPLTERSAFPRQPAIYFAIDSLGKVLYVGISKDPKRRWLQHHRYEQLQQAGKIKVAYLFVDDIALLKPIENALIAWFRPPLNVTGIPVDNPQEKGEKGEKSLKKLDLGENKTAKLTICLTPTGYKAAKERAKNEGVSLAEVFERWGRGDDVNFNTSSLPLPESHRLNERKTRFNQPVTATGKTFNRTIEILEQLKRSIAQDQQAKQFALEFIRLIADAELKLADIEKLSGFMELTEEEVNCFAAMTHFFNQEKGRE